MTNAAHFIISMVLALSAISAQADVTKMIGHCEFFEPEGNSENECEILKSKEDGSTILAAPERLVMFKGDVTRDSVVYWDGYRFDAFEGNAFGYCFREEKSGVAVCVTPYQ